MAELMLGQPLFPGESGIDQLVEIIKVLGTPTREQIRTMNPNYMEHKFPQIKPHPFNKVRRRPVSFSRSLVAGKIVVLINSRSSARHRQRPLTSSQPSWNTLPLNGCRPSKPCATPSSTNCGTPLPGYQIRDTTTTHPRTCLPSLTSHDMVSWSETFRATDYLCLV